MQSYLTNQKVPEEALDDPPTNNFLWINGYISLTENNTFPISSVWYNDLGIATRFVKNLPQTATVSEGWMHNALKALGQVYPEAGIPVLNGDFGGGPAMLTNPLTSSGNIKSILGPTRTELNDVYNKGLLSGKPPPWKQTAEVLEKLEQGGAATPTISSFPNNVDRVSKTYVLFYFF
jgi:hypothetical protein